MDKENRDSAIAANPPGEMAQNNCEGALKVEESNISKDKASGRPSWARRERYHKPGAEPWPFTGMPRRNLIYHIWPVRGSMWKWNLDQLKSRLGIFNGNRVIGVVHDDRSESPDLVKEYLGGDGFEFIVSENNDLGEAATFPLMMERVASVDPNEITCYAHAKGVSYGSNVTLGVKRWVEVLYRVTLDDCLTVHDQLRRYAMTGPFKTYGRHAPHRRLADWHYSGTFFWMRNAHVFSRDYKNVPQFNMGVEVWPGIMFRHNETTCLFMDNVTHDLYRERFWRDIGNLEFKKWEAGIKHLPIPLDSA